jgi:hypothetical protein
MRSSAILAALTSARECRSFFSIAFTCSSHCSLPHSTYLYFIQFTHHRAMASLGCCTSKKPPSPDGLPTRPADISKTVPAAEPLHVASWSTASGFSKDAAELRAIFETGDPDSDDEIDEFMPKKKTSSTLTAVKTKLRKHFSRDSGISKNRRHSSIGQSEEEVERRKELKLLRNKRIQQELSNDIAYDDDAKSLSTVATGKGTPKSRWTMFSVQQATPQATSPLARSPRKSDPTLGRPLQSLEPCSTLSRRHSLGALGSPGSLKITLHKNPRYSETSNLSVPPAPILQPQRLPSIVDPATRRTSWRLSFASDQRACQLRSLSYQGGGTPCEPAQEPQNQNLGPLRWFRSQGLHMSSLVNTKPSDHTGELESPPRPATRSSTGDYGGVDGNSEDGNPELRTSLHLHEMGISQRLASKGLQSSSSLPQLSSWSSRVHTRSHSYVSGDSHYMTAAQSLHFRNTSSSAATELKSSQTIEDVLGVEISSFSRTKEDVKSFTADTSLHDLSCLAGMETSKTPMQVSEVECKFTLLFQESFVKYI